MSDRYKTRRWIKIVSIILVAIIVIGYTLYEVQKIVFGPKITVLSPKNGALVSESLLELTGKTQNIKDISLNDNKIFIDEKGNFSEKLLLSYGYNILALKASDKFGRKTEKTLEIIYK